MTEITIRIYKKDRKYGSSRSIFLSDSEVDEMLRDYVKKEHLSESEELEQVDIETFSM